MGVIDPSHSLAQKPKFGELPPWVPMDEALARAAADPKWSPWTPELLRGIQGEWQERGDHISASTLVSECPRAEVIARKADFIGDLNDMYMTFRGTMIHAVLEKYAGPDTIAEHRFFATLGGIEISCSPDLLSKTTLWDYKVTESPPMYQYPRSHHTEQVELNAAIVRNAHTVSPGGRTVVSFTTLPFDPRQHPATSVALVYLGPRWPKVLTVEKSITGVVELKSGAVLRRVKVPDVWDDDKVEKHFLPRLEVMSAALDAYPTWPSGAEDVWGGPPGWECPGKPLCGLPNCLAKRRILTW